MFTIDKQAVLALESEFQGVQKLVGREVKYLSQVMFGHVVANAIKATPKRTGATVTHWVATKGSPSSRKYAKSKAIEDYNEKALEFIEKIGPYEKMYYTNNSDVMAIIEDGKFVPSDPGPSKDTFTDVLGRKRKGGTWVVGGFSTQAPEGVSKKVYNMTKIRYTKIWKFTTHRGGKTLTFNPPAQLKADKARDTAIIRQGSITKEEMKGLHKSYLGRKK